MPAFGIIKGVGVIGGKPVEHGEVWADSTGGQGVRVNCGNGYRVSVAWGPYHYGNGEEVAEVGIVDLTVNELIYRDEWNDSVAGWQTPDEVWAIYKMVDGWV